MNVKITYHQTNTQDQSFEIERTMAIEPSGDVEAAARVAFWQTLGVDLGITAVRIIKIEIL